MMNIPAPRDVPTARLALSIPLLFMFQFAFDIAPGHAEDTVGEIWGQWRGSHRDGRVAGMAWPEDFSTLELLWRSELGKGYSGPIVGADRVFVVETVDGEMEGARAIDRHSGKELWSTSWSGKGKVPFFAKRNGDWVRSTPAYDGESLYVGGMEEVLRRLDARTGIQIWSIDLPEHFGTSVPDFGFASSPLVAGDAVFVQAANSLVRLDRRTGDVVWRTLESSGVIQQSGAFSSPVLTNLAGQPQLLVQTRSTLHGVDPDRGTVLWSQDVPSFRGMNILTPTVHGDTVFTSTYKNNSFLYRIKRGGDAWMVEEVWSHKSKGYMSSPVIVDDHAYLHMGNSRVTCLDLASGEDRWTTEPFGDYWSMALQGDKILALDEEGMLHLIRANPQAFEPLDSREISESPTWGHIAVGGGQIFVRELRAIAAYSWTAPESATGMAP